MMRAATTLCAGQFLRARWLPLAAVLLPQLALAAPKSAASDAAPSKKEGEQARRLRNASRYVEANREVLTCSNPACGALLSEECEPDCTSSSVDSVRQKYSISTASLGVGAAAAVGAVTWYVLARPSTPEPPARIQVWSSGGGVSARFSAPF